MLQGLVIWSMPKMSQRRQRMSGALDDVRSENP